MRSNFIDRLTSEQYRMYLALEAGVILQESRLRFEIDKALDSGDREAFEKYAKELCKLKGW